MITPGELEDLAYLPEEIARIDMEISNLKRPSYLMDMDTRQRAECAAALTDLVRSLQKQRQACVTQLKKLQAFVDSIDDPFICELFQLRYGRALEWGQVSRIITERGFCYEEGSLRQMCRRYIEKYNRNDQDQNNKKGTKAPV